MANHIRKIHLKDLFDLFEQETRRLDVILCRDEYLIAEVQSLLEDEKSVTLVTLEPDDLHNQKTILNGLHDIFFDEALSDNDEPLDIIEAIEDELGELESCLLIVEDFSSCNIETQAALLELVVVSRAFKLLLKVDDDIVFSENENLWDVLAVRSGILEKEKENSFFMGDDESGFEEEQRDEQGDEQELEYSEQTSYQENQQKQNKKLAWYQMLPKYHIAAGVFLIVLVFALWNMDISQKKEQAINLELDKNISENNTDPSTTELSLSESEINDNTIENPIDEISENNQTEGALVLGSEEGDVFENQGNKESAEIVKNVKTIEGVEVIEVEKSVEVATPQTIKQQAINPQVIKKQEPPTKVAEVKVSKPTPVVQAPKKTNWSPYQSDKWIMGVNNKYYTLQLMASHDEQGVRNFLKEHGVNSQYAVYTTEKNNKPWHVVIYGVYQTHEFASKARKDLPDYLKSYSPWVRSFADVQKTIK